MAKQKFALAAALFLGVATAIAGGAAPAGAKTLSFGVVPQQSPPRLARLWTPLIADVAARAGVAMRFTTAKDIATFEARLYAGEYDLAYVNPMHFVRAETAAGYRALARAQDHALRGVIVVAADSPFVTLADLDGAAVAFPSQNAFGATLLNRLAFADAGATIRPEFVRSHDSVYRAVAAGGFAAGGGVPRTFGAMPADMRAGLRVLYETRGFSPHAFAGHPELPRDVAAHIVDALIALAQTDDGRRILDDLRLKPLTAATSGDYADIRAIDAALSEFGR